MYRTMFINFQTINPTMTHLAVAAVLFLLLLWIKKLERGYELPYESRPEKGAGDFARYAILTITEKEQIVSLVNRQKVRL